MSNVVHKNFENKRVKSKHNAVMPNAVQQECEMHRIENKHLFNSFTANNFFFNFE